MRVCKNIIKINNKKDKDGNPVEKECGNFMTPKEGKWYCPRCLHEEAMESKEQSQKDNPRLKQIKKEVEDCPVVDAIEGTMPKTNVTCPKCEHNEAYWFLRQTRKSDEPETTFLCCCKCGHRWRKY